ncbi:Hypp5987 [Branchiostoma lanceolatum]|uniref:Hypp5987 protein n=1 Tax=Branchiostoma lanceolatum TaxID=7740 RepID=A0A8J9YSN4_BRALA|nr:Hypp5987 [Branchiostoma lanceolatum]
MALKLLVVLAFISAARADSHCTAHGGVCTDYRYTTCKGGYLQSLCNGDSNRRCCVSCDDACQANEAYWSDSDDSCTYAGGLCKHDTNYCPGGYVSGMCGGPTHRRCCLQETGTPTITPSPSREFRGVWVATVSNIDWPSSRHLSTEQQKAELVTILDRMVELNLNALVFQVRPAGDAFYDSQLEPWSYYLSGRHGSAPSPYYDPLAFAIEESHRRGIELHAWFNPYRAKSKSASYSLASNHMANRFPQYTYDYGNYLWMDPGAEDVADHTYDVIIDVVRRYDVDGVQFDDYFYPYPISGTDFPDTATYRAYQTSGGTMSKPDWRRDNVNRLVRRLYSGIHAEKAHVKFGISPFGIWRSGYPAGIVGFSQYDSLYADPKLWLEQGWVDYLAPQLYWMIDPPQQSYPALLDWWLDQNPLQRHIYTGNYLSRILTDGWPVSELMNQVGLSRDRADRLSLGNIMFSMKPFRDNSAGAVDAFKSQVYPSPVLTPAMPWLGSRAPKAPSGVQVASDSITWSGDESGDVRVWTLYRQEGDGRLSMVKVLGADTTTTTVDSGTYMLKAVDRVGNESSDVTVEVP